MPVFFQSTEFTGSVASLACPEVSPQGSPRRLERDVLDSSLRDASVLSSSL